MKAILFEHYGSTDVLKVTDVEKPILKTKQILIQVKAFGINPIDWKLRRGDMQSFIPLPLPFILGSEAAGVVVELSDDVHDLNIGDRVYGRTQHAYAEYCIMNADQVAPIPEFLSFKQAASLASGPQVAYSALKTVAKLKNGQKVLIHAGAGGVGTAAIQIAKSSGAHVTTTVSKTNIDLVKQLGADEVIDYQVEDITTLQPNFDLILDSLGGAIQIQSWDLLKDDGCLVSLVSDEQQNFAPSAHHKTFHFMRGVQGNPSQAVHQLIQTQQLRPVIDQVFEFEDIAQAHLKSETGHVSGKLVINLES